MFKHRNLTQEEIEATNLYENEKQGGAIIDFRCVL